MHHSVAIILIRENEIILKSTLLPVFWKQTGYKPKKEAGVLGGKSRKKPWIDTMRTEAAFSQCAPLVLNSLLLTSCFFCVCLHTMLHVLRSSLIVSENIAFLCHDSYWRHTSASKDTNLLPLPCKRLDAWLGWLRKLMAVPFPEADQQVSSISSFELSALALKWSTYNYFAATTTQWNLCFLPSYWLFFLFFFSWRSQP